MSNITKVAIVTGSNRGIGHSIVKFLAPDYKGDVFLTARDEEQGQKAVKEFAEQGIKVKFHQLDIDDINSINRLADFIKTKYGGLDLLVNNAAIAYKQADTTPFATQAEHTIRVNYTGTLNVCNALFPLLRPHARVVNVSSRAGMLKIVKDADMRARLSSNSATIEDITKCMNEFIEAAKNGTNAKISSSAYGMSKVGLTAATRVQQRMFDKDSRPDLIVNAVCPGLIATGMSSFNGKPVDEGAITPLHLAMIPENASGPKGEFWADKARVNWEE